MNLRPQVNLSVRSRVEILNYLARVEHSLTLWGGAEDMVDMELLYQLVREVGADRVYVDVPFQYDPPPPPPPKPETRQFHSLLINSINYGISLFSSKL